MSSHPPLVRLFLAMLFVVCPWTLRRAITAEPGIVAANPSIEARVMELLWPLKETIDRIEFYGIQVDAERRFSYGVQKGRQHVFIRFAAGDQSGWSELNLGSGKESETLEKRLWHLKWYQDLIGKTPAEAMQHLLDSRNILNYRELEIAEIGVLDLGGKLLGRPAVELLELTEREPIPGLFAILSDAPETVRKEAARALEQNLRTHLKVKLYGNPDVDCKIITAARDIYGAEAYLVGDVNMGYRREVSSRGVDDIVQKMHALHEAGLNACEDPAEMSHTQWAAVQKQINQLDLVPDVPLRPAWEARTAIKPEMGRVFNMHPHCMGSILATVELGQQIKSWEKKLMVGDASLIGPACPVWQQIAIGLGADWVEAIEKPQESDLFQQCLVNNPVTRTKDGRFKLDKPLAGFGVELDVEELTRVAYDVFLYGEKNPASDSNGRVNTNSVIAPSQ